MKCALSTAKFFPVRIVLSFFAERRLCAKRIRLRAAALALLKSLKALWYVGL